MGLGHRALLDWALADIRDARAAGGHDQQRHATNAVLNARRALSCLVDEYLNRDGFNFCKDAPADADRKAEVLLARGVFDHLANSSLLRAITRRNLVEHQYRSPTLAEAEDIVHVVRASIEATVARHPPYEATALVGTIAGGSSGPSDDLTQRQFWFGGWSGLAFVIVREVDPAWFGVIVPSSDVDAVVRKLELRNITCALWTDALMLLDQAQPSGGKSPDLWLRDLKAAGLA